MKLLSRFYTALVFLVLYAPIIVVVFFSFNSTGNFSTFSGFSFRWYGELFRDNEALDSLKNSLILALISSILATLIGTFAALGIDRCRNKPFKSAMKAVANIPMMNPDIVTGVSMMLLFVAVGTIIGSQEMLGFETMLIAHTTFIIPYVILSVLPKFQQMDKNLCEAAYDLGCTPIQTFLRVELPFIFPGIASGFMMGCALSLDDFVISHFVSSPDFKTLPLYVYNQTLRDMKFSMYALYALMIFVMLALLIAVNLLGSAGEKKKTKKTI